MNAPVPDSVLRALRDPRLRRYHAALVFAELWVSLDRDEERVAKINQTARTLGIQRREMRRALELLEALGFLAFVKRDEWGRRYYRIGEGGAPCTPFPPRTADAA